ncbi:WD repeat-containing protein 76 [Spatholobus suberectus]|nr:WD repeat-containing protein 76 [Spatholobus suberectus]
MLATWLPDDSGGKHGGYQSCKAARGCEQLKILIVIFAVVTVQELLRVGIPPDSKCLDRDTVDSTTPTKAEPFVPSLGPLSVADTRESTHSDSSFIESLVGTLASNKTEDVSANAGIGNDWR